MAYEDESVNVERAWKSFKAKAQDKSAHALWENKEWADGGLREAAKESGGQSAAGPSGNRPLSFKEQAIQQSKPKKRWKGFAGTAAAVLLVAFLVFGPWGGNIMAAMLQTFTVQRIQGVHVNQNEITKIQDALTKATPNGATLNFKDYGKITKIGGGPAQQVTLKTAEAKINGPILTFPKTSQNQVVNYEPGMRFHLKLHVQKVNQLLKNLGGSAMLPANLNGQTIQMVLPAILEMQQAGSSQVTLTQVRVPQLDVPSDVDVEKVKKAVLGLPIIPDSIRNRIEGTTNWKKTLFVPLMNPKDHQTTVLGHQAVIYAGKSQNNQQNERILVWLQQGHIYMLRGPAAKFSTDQTIIQKAKEIIRNGAHH